jgi:hypothetical protein
MTQDKPPTTTKLTSAEQRRRRDDRTTAIRLRFAIQRHLGDREITSPAAIGEALGMPGAEAIRLLTRHIWREGDVARLEAAAARLGLQVPGRGD